MWSAILMIAFAACKEEPKTPPVEEKKPPVVRKNVKVPRFDKDSAYQYIAKQTEFGPRVPNTPEHVACKDWLVAKMKDYADDVVVQTFDAKAYTGDVLKSFNIIGRFNPEKEKRVLLFAHWDTRPWADHDPDPKNHKTPVLGADDGGSGVGVLMEIARQIKLNPIDMGVDIMFVDSEDYGNDGANDPNSWGLGSQYWSKNKHVAGYNAKYGILLDMVGTKGSRFPKEGFSMQYARGLTNKVWTLAKNMGYGNFFVNELAGGVTDDHYFVNTIARIPSIDIINKPVGDQSFGDHWHTINDDMSNIDKKPLRAVGQVVLAVIYNESGNSF